MHKLSSWLQAQAGLTSSESALIAARFEPVSLAKNAFLLRAGQVCQHYYFIEEGSCRVHFVHGEADVTGWLAFEGDFFTELHSFRTGQASRFSIEALEPLQVWRLPRVAHEELLRTQAAWSGVVRQVWEEAFLRVVDGILLFQTATAEQRYALLQGQANYSQRVPLKDLASFLGITPTTLSRLRGKK